MESDTRGPDAGAVRPSGAAPPARGDVARIVVRDEFGPTFAAAFPECDITVGCGETRLSATVRDQSELFGLIERVRDFGAVLVSVSLDK